MMATKQRISGSNVAKACPKCGEAPGDSGFCPRCDRHTVPAEPARRSGDQRGGQPSDWRRLVTGGIASLLVVLALILLDAASCDPNVWFDCFMVDAERYAAYSLLVMAGPFALATLMPFGTSRRVVVGLGAALLSSAAVFVGGANVVEPLGEGAIPFVWAWIGAGVAFCLAFYAGYRIAR